MTDNYDAILIVSFGGPEKREDVIPFLENVLRGKSIPRERMLEVAEHYYRFDGVSPINAQNREFIAALGQELQAHGPHLPVYWGNRNWHPLLKDTLQQMRDDRIERALAFVTSAFSSYSGCRQYLEDIEWARAEVGRGAPQVDKLRTFFNHPGFIHPVVEHVQAALGEIPAERHETTQIIYTAHSIPEAMSSRCQYTDQLNEACQLVSDRLEPFDWQLVYQSRSGSPSQPWLEPDVCDYLRGLQSSSQFTDVVLTPIGFISDHMEILFDLDTEAREVCEQLGINMVRAKTVGTHPMFIRMIRELTFERTSGSERHALGGLNPGHDVCPPGCCLSGRSQTNPSSAKGSPHHEP